MKPRKLFEQIPNAETHGDPEIGEVIEVGVVSGSTILPRKYRVVEKDDDKIFGEQVAWSTPRGLEKSQ